MNQRTSPFSKQDHAQIRDHGIPVEVIQQQLEQFRSGFPPVKLLAPATGGNGIMTPDPSEIDRYAQQYEHLQGGLRTIKFIPASGAASRMFKQLHAYLNHPVRKDQKTHETPEVDRFVRGIPKMALESELRQVLKGRGQVLEDLLNADRKREIISAVLDQDGLNYGSLPKGLIPFHRYPDENRTPVAEHMIEGAAYCKDSTNKVRLHFTVSKEHLDPFIEMVATLRPGLEKRLGVKYQIDFSIQQSYTDTIAVDPANDPFRSDDGTLVFRPGGHGALLANLQELDAEVVFIKNIDNIGPDRLKPITYRYKKALAGVLLEVRQQVFHFLGLLENADTVRMNEIQRFIEDRLNYRLSTEEKQLSGADRKEMLQSRLDRPIRVCGMVKNEGEPGGGPFWVEGQNGSRSLQIVEGSQIDKKDDAQRSLVARSTHFNPVDLVCSISNLQGDPYPLQEFIDPSTGFISRKSQGGRALKALELPGLWNGSMAHWNTIFIEVPIETFTPVKTINDLLRPEHIV